MKRTLDIARHYHDSGFAVLPLWCDGSKATRIKWRAYPWFQLERWFTMTATGIGLLCGNLSKPEVLDFDDPNAYPQWARGIDPLLLDCLPLIETPSGGRHLYYRCPTIENNLVLARDAEGGIVIETRGQGGMVVACGSPPSVHPTNKPYRLLHGNPFNPPTITPEQRATLLEQARRLNHYTKPERSKSRLARLRQQHAAAIAQVIR